jgi:hypothetical protein
LDFAIIQLTPEHSLILEVEIGMLRALIFFILALGLTPSSPVRERRVIERKMEGGRKL